MSEPGATPGMDGTLPPLLQAAYRSQIALRLSKACHRWSHRYQTATNLKANNAMQRAITSQPFQLFVSDGRFIEPGGKSSDTLMGKSWRREGHGDEGEPC